VGLRQIVALGAVALVTACAAPATAPKTDMTLTLECLKEHRPLINGGSAAVSLVDGDTGWGACVVSVKNGPSYETIWKGHGKDWTLAANVPVGATGAEIAKKTHGISLDDANALAKAAHKPVLRI
jgi:outer membrane biogenesis lipoprotein LolB